MVQVELRAAGRRDGARAAPARIVDQLEDRFPEAAGLLDEVAPDPTRLHRLSQGALAAGWCNNSLERLNREIRRRTDVVGIFPDRPRRPARRRGPR